MFKKKTFALNSLTNKGSHSRVKWYRRRLRRNKKNGY